MNTFSEKLASVDIDNLVFQDMFNPLFYVFKHKWNIYGRNKFFTELSFLFFYMILYMISLFWLHYSESINNVEKVFLNIFDGLLLIILLYFTKKEFY